jgi:predicted ArsR family transcriptional regulator
VTNPPVADEPTEPTEPFDAIHAIEAVALLDEPSRRRLYDLVASRHEAVGRDDAAAALGMSRELAAFHLDRLAEAGLLETEYRRLSGRTGPGAGRPAKLYRRADRVIAVTLPPRHYDLAADVMATALERLGDGSGMDAVSAVAHAQGARAGSEARRRAGTRRGGRRSMAGLLDVLRAAGYEPAVDPADGSVSLRNCPFDALVADHREMTCGMNLAWASGLIEGSRTAATAELQPEPGRCCVVFHTTPTTSSEAA